MYYLQQDAPGLFEAVHFELLEINAAVGNHKHHKQLLWPKHVDRVILRAVALVPEVPFLAQCARITSLADAHSVRLNKCLCCVCRQHS